MSIRSAEIWACWLFPGAKEVSSWSRWLVSNGKLQHQYVVINSTEGWYCVEKVGDGKHYIHGPFEDSDAAHITGCQKKGCIDRTALGIELVESTGPSTKNMQDVREEFSGCSEYDLLFEAMNCKGFTRKVMRFLQDRGDDARVFGLFMRTTSPNYLDMYVGQNQRKTFDNDTVSEVRHVYGGFFYKQRVYVTVKRSCNLAIRDESGDVYSCSCIRTGEHYVDYNSKRPAIVKVSW
eukprot:TRINITY_DN83506_c0_g1_i1.p1 TRINITY_DN83506_c0_g1~~TRINITY_DN83506_c0_g1_i1.p1  ORF type:complete len:235 (-),score=30.58 TRINITY_DN83506_c0_g1_i1:291-995(-)